MDMDRLASLSHVDASHAASAVLNRLQKEGTKETQLAALLIVLEALAEQSGHRLADLANTVDNLSRDSTRRRQPNVAAIHDYIREELLS